MFVVITSTEHKKGKRRQIFRRRPAYEINKKDIGNTYFYILNAISYNGKIKWKTVLKAVPDTPGNIITDKGLAFPKNCNFKPYDTSGYIKTLYFNLFCCFLQQCLPSNLHIAIIDKEGRLCNEALALLRQAASVYVVTANQQRYLAVNETAGKLYGAELIIVDSISPVMKSAAILAPFGTCGYGSLQNHPFLFAPKQGFEFGSEDIILPPAIERVRPAGVDKIEFAAALYEKCRINSLSGLTPVNIAKEGVKIPVKTAIKLLSDHNYRR
ncbi:MAG TPA: hypothetical protein GXX17_02735 [Clostridiales bacterium]|nr:hypothetical protein [Clostridiales bacterium]